MADGQFPSLVSKDRDVNALANPIFVQPSDGTNSIVIGPNGELEVVQDTHGDLNANVTLQINDVDVSATVPVPISATAAANSLTNPIYVRDVEDSSDTDEVHDFDTAASVAAGATSTHTYTVTGTTFLLRSIIVAGSGNVKFEIQTGATASPSTVAVGFLTGREGDSKQITFNPAIEVPVTGTGIVNVIRTNRQNQAADVYSTIIGNDVV